MLTGTPTAGADVNEYGPPRGRLDRAEEAVPPYVEVAEALESDILRGRYGPGERLPTEKALATERGVNRNTAARALNRLQSKGLAYRVARRGTFVRPGRIRYAVTDQGGFTVAVSAAGLQPAHEILDVGKVGAYGRIPAEMRVPVGEPLVFLHRLSYAGEIPLTYSTKHFRSKTFPGLEDLLGACPSLRALVRSHYGLELYRARLCYGLAAADPDISRCLGVPAGTALLKEESLFVLDDGSPAEWTVSHSRGDNLWLSIDVRGVKEVRD